MPKKYVTQVCGRLLSKKAKTLLQVNFCQKLFFLDNMGRTCCVQKLFCMSKTISVHNMFSPCSELGIFMY